MPCSLNLATVGANAHVASMSKTIQSTGTGHLFFYRGGLPAQNFASVAKGKHCKIFTGSWQPLVSVETCYSCNAMI